MNFINLSKKITNIKNPFIKKYQPKYLNEFELENNLVNILNTFIKLDNLNIIFVANSGCGKTTIISAIIREYYGEKYNEINDNILYINSLKEQGITFYRTEMKTFCQTASNIKNKKKIVVLDDIDLINEQSQQVFRNCIDKYSHNVHFIASCVNTQKVIDSIQSRLNIIKIEPINHYNLINILNKIKINENINIDDEAQKFILSICNNSIRILINYIEKFKLLDEKNINKELAIKICTNINFNEFEIYTNLCLNNKLTEAIKIIYNIYDAGYSVIDIFDNYFLFIKSTKMIDEVIKYEIIKVLCKYITVFHNIHEDEIELALFTNNIIKLFNKNYIF
jgi:DNA polymerase III delta prime subunit